MMHNLRELETLESILLALTKKRFTEYERSAYTCVKHKQVYQNIGTPIIFV